MGRSPGQCKMGGKTMQTSDEGNPTREKKNSPRNTYYTPKWGTTITEQSHQRPVQAPQPRNQSHQRPCPIMTCPLRASLRVCWPDCEEVRISGKLPEAQGSTTGHSCNKLQSRCDGSPSPVPLFNENGAVSTAGQNSLVQTAPYSAVSQRTVENHHFLAVRGSSMVQNGVGNLFEVPK